MADADRSRWNQRYEAGHPASGEGDEPPSHLADLTHLLPSAGVALVLACGRGHEVAWAADRGFATVVGWDVSPVAIDLARQLVERRGLADRCRVTVADLDDGLPPSPAADLVICHLFRDARLDEAVTERLGPGGVLALVCLSEVGAEPGPFRVEAGGLLDAFGHLDVLHHDEGAGVARLVARNRWTERTGGA